MAGTLPGSMQPFKLTLNKILEYAEKWHGDQEICCRTVEGATVVSSYADLARRSRLCASALNALGCRQGSVVATLAWNTTRHMECWYGIAGIGAICHTLNPRLSDKDLVYIINHAGDGVLLADITFVGVLERIVPQCPTLRHVILMTDTQHMPRSPALPGLLCYEHLLDEQMGRPAFEWPQLEEDMPCGLCYTSGTTGNPKGVIYTHRSNWLHSMIVTQPDALCLGAGASVMMIVPMFHANSWGLAFAAPMVGAKLVLPGPHLDGASIHHMLAAHNVTHTAGVPTVWLGLLQHMEQHKLKLPPTLRIAVIGGAAPPRSMVEALEGLGAEVRHMWGMTELSPIGSINVLKGTIEATGSELIDYKVSQGRPHLFCDWRIVDDENRELPHDGKAVGHLQVRGPHTVQRYHKLPGAPAADAQGWFDTGDVASIDEHGYMRITDRSKDVIKSGGEWISSIEVENLAMGHRSVLEAAVIGMPDERWGERPLLIVVARPPAQGSEQLKQELLQFLAPKLAKYALPDDVAFVADIPHTATGKISKLTLRKMFEGYKPARSKL